MHNKSFTVDNQVTVIGGRNIGNEYFGATEGVLFVDLDVMAVGPIVTDESNDFDRYWASASSYLVERLSARVLRQTSQPMQRISSETAQLAYTLKRYANWILFNTCLRAACH